MKPNVFFSCLVGAALCMGGTAGAAEAPSNALPATNNVSLDAVAAEVLERNPELNFYKAEIAAAKAERRVASSIANPELTTQLGGKRVRGGGASDEGVAWSVSVQQTFEWPGRIPLRKAIANQQITLAELGLAQFRAALNARVRILAYSLFAAQQKAAAAREVADRFQALREVLVQRDPAGLTPLLETRVIEATEITLHRQASEAAVEMQSAMLELNQLRGQPWEQPVQITPTNLTFASTSDPEALLAAARTNNFELKMRQAELQQQGFRISLARNERYPALSVGPYFSEERAGERETQAGIGITLPLPLWNRNQGNLQVAQAREQQAQTSLYVTQREVERKVVEAAARYAAKLDEMSRWRPDSVEQFREAAALADRHYRLGAVPISTYVELQKQYLEAVTALLETRKEAMESRLQLETLTGLSFPAPKP